MRITRLGFRFALAALALCVVAGPSRADDGLKIETILSDLDNPSGVAIQPETGCCICFQQRRLASDLSLWMASPSQ